MMPAQARRMLFAVCPGVYAGTVPVLRNPCAVPFRVQELHPYGPMPCLWRKLASCRWVLGVSARPGALSVKTLLRFTGAAQFTMHLGTYSPVGYCACGLQPLRRSWGAPLHPDVRSASLSNLSSIGLSESPLGGASFPPLE